MNFNDKINGQLLSSIGTTGTADLLSFPERKEVIENDWAEENGGEYDLSLPKFKDKDVTLTFGILANNDVQFWQYHTALFNILKQSGVLKLYIADHSREYNVFYKKSENFKKVAKRLKNVTKVYVKFDITFKILIDK